MQMLLAWPTVLLETVHQSALHLALWAQAIFLLRLFQEFPFSCRGDDFKEP